jgi:tetratricopeptide (TPR) repeat protein
MAVLKTDQVTLFPGAIDYLKDRTDLDSLALYGQIELAWGETYMLLMEILMRVRDDFALTAEQLEQSDALDEVAKERLGWLYGSSEELALRIKALELVAIDHLSAGFDLAEQVMLNHADSYLGYRLAADYYRTLRDWENFELMRIAIEERNPESNGLMFLRAAAAMQAEGDRDKADDLYRKALAHDPHFVRAQVHLLIIQSDLEHTYRELLALEKLNPHHQFVALAGPAIKAAYAARKIEAALWLER